MSCDRFGEMFKGDSADTHVEKFSLMSMGAERRIPGAQNEDPRQRDRKFYCLLRDSPYFYILFLSWFSASRHRPMFLDIF